MGVECRKSCSRWARSACSSDSWAIDHSGPGATAPDAEHADGYRYFTLRHVS